MSVPRGFSYTVKQSPYAATALYGGIKVDRITASLSRRRATLSRSRGGGCRQCMAAGAGAATDLDEGRRR